MNAKLMDATDATAFAMDSETYPTPNRLLNESAFGFPQPNGTGRKVNGSRVAIGSGTDIRKARKAGRALAIQAGFAADGATLIATAISEVARNIVEYASPGEIIINPIEQRKKKGLQILARDEGPGIPDVNQALQYDCPSRKRMGVGLPGTKYLMDDFAIVSQVGKGTTVTMTKWRVP